MGQDFSYLFVILEKKVNIKLFLVASHHVVLFRFQTKSKHGPRSTAPYSTELLWKVYHHAFFLSKNDQNLAK
jgi:hypothetical protein